MKLLPIEQHVARKVCGISEANCCPVVLVSGSATPRLVQIPSHYVDGDREWIYTPGIEYGTNLLGYRYVPAQRMVEVSRGWLLRLRSGPWVNGKEHRLIKLTDKELRQCCSDALAGHPPPYDVLVIPGESAPEWEECDPYIVDLGTLVPIQAEIRIVVGENYIFSARARAQNLRYQEETE